MADNDFGLPLHSFTSVAAEQLVNTFLTSTGVVAVNKSAQHISYEQWPRLDVLKPSLRQEASWPPNQHVAAPARFQCRQGAAEASEQDPERLMGTARRPGQPRAGSLTGHVSSSPCKTSLDFLPSDDYHLGRKTNPVMHHKSLWETSAF